MAYNIEIEGLELKTKEGNNILGSDFNVEIKELDETTRSFWAIASDETEDRDKDIIRVEGWKLKNFKSNPVGLWAHDYRSHPHFKVEKTRIDKEKKQFLFKPIFDTHELANISYNQYKNSFLNMFSVGFNPIEHSLRNPDNWSSGREFIKQELLEISAVPVPSNPNASVLRSAGLIPDIVNLITLGYSEEYKILEDGTIWVPINNSLKGYKDPRRFHIGCGVTAVSAIPIFDKDSKIHPAIGYIFDKTFDVDKINNWFKDNDIKNSIQKFYSVNFQENGEFYLNISEEIKELEIEGIGSGLIPTEKDFENDNIQTPSEDENSQCSDNLESSESSYKDITGIITIRTEDKKITIGIKDGKSEIQTLRYKKDVWDSKDAKTHCSTRKGTFEAASTSESNYEDISGIITIRIEDKKTTIGIKDEDGKFFDIPLFDNVNIDNVKIIIDDVKKEILSEIKEMLKIVEVEKDLKIEDGKNDEKFQISGLEFESLVSQDENDEKFIINPDEIKDLEIDIQPIEDKVNFIFNESLREILNNK